MENEQPATPEMTDDESTALLQRLYSHAGLQAQKAFEAGDRARFDFWDYRASQLNGLIAAESMKEDLKKLIFGRPKA